MRHALQGAVLLACSACAAAQTSSPVFEPNLEVGFRVPPDSAKPRVWWHWMDGNISKEGIRLDLEWMHRVGVAGITVFEGAIDTPQIVPHRLTYMSPEWKAAFRFAVTNAHDLGMEVAIASSPGWSETGGPWVPPSEAMKKMVWSETQLRGDVPFMGVLAPPPDTTGTFQNFAVEPRRIPGHNDSFQIPALPRFYGDAAVIAYRTPSDEQSQPALNPNITTSAGLVNGPKLSDGDIGTVALSLSAPAATEASWVLFDYGQPTTLQAITLATSSDIIRIFDQAEAPFPMLEASDDGKVFRFVTNVTASSVPQQTSSFDPVRARYFRLIFPAAQDSNGAPRHHEITELVLRPSSRINQFEKKAGFATALNYDDLHNPVPTEGSIVDSKDVIDLTSRMNADGSLHWTPPSGNWTVLRIGYSLTGHENGPAPQEATGLEVDKLNKTSVQHYLSHYLDSYASTVGQDRMGSGGVQWMLTDSIEAGSQNWTEQILSEFQHRRGYDPRPWLPTMTGVIVGSVAGSDRFLWDFRQTLAELIAENHYGTIAEELHSRHMLYYGEALEYRRPNLGDDMSMRSRADVPMGAMWAFPQGGQPNPTYPADIRGAASVAHIYGQNLVGAESLTASHDYWTYSPRNLKTVADLEFALGVNRFIIHESTHQPVNGKVPGLTLERAGQFFSRNETWAEQAAPWIQYLARCSFLLQQGHFVADIAYFYGEEGPITAAFGVNSVADVPDGYAFDFVNADALMRHLSVADHQLRSASGTSYRVLYLGGASHRITLPTLKRIRDLVSKGIVLVGSRPTDSPSLSDDQAEFHAVANALWGAASRSDRSAIAYGDGLVYGVGDLAGALQREHLPADFEYTRPSATTSLLFLHRNDKGADIYFVSNRNARAEDLEATFRIGGRVPEIWNAADGSSRPTSYRIAHGRTSLPLHLDPDGSAFIIFRKHAVESSRELPAIRETELAQASPSLNRDWHLTFQRDRGAPSEIALSRLSSWSDSSISGVRYFSGTATYSKKVELQQSWLPSSSHLWLDLGDVREVVEVKINGHSLGTLWKAPYRLDVSEALNPGSNDVVLKVTNLWVDRLIGDAQPQAKRRYTFTDFQPYSANDPLLPSGILGPIRIVARSE